MCFFGATRKNNPSHQNLLKSIEIHDSDENKIDCWKKGKPLLNDHAVGVEVDDNMIEIYDNGCVHGDFFTNTVFSNKNAFYD